MTCARGVWSRFSLALATALVAAAFVPLSAAYGATLSPGCTTVSLASAFVNANSNGADDVIRIPTCPSPYVLTAPLPVSPDIDSFGKAHKLVVRGRGEFAVITQNQGAGTRLFEVQPGANVLFKNLTLSKGKSPFAGMSGGGGAIYIDNDATVRIEDSRVVDGLAPIGGGIFNDRGTLTIVDSTFVDNRGESGGGAIANDGTLTVSGARFFRNRATGASSMRGGGAITNGPNARATIVDSVFGANTSTTPGGGAIRNESPRLTISRSTFSENTGPAGGALLNSTGSVSLSDSTISGNGTPATTGGGIANGLPNNPQAVMSIDRSTVSDNVGGNGGGIYNAGKLSFSGSVGADNAGSLTGGAFFNVGRLTISDASVAANSSASSAGGAFNSNNGSLTIVASTLTDNLAAHGGAVLNAGGKLFVTGSTVSGNTATTFGGGIRQSSGDMDVAGTTFSGNTSQRGGAVDSAGRVTVTGSTLVDNSAAGGSSPNGGAVYYGGQQTLQVTDSRLSRNLAREGGAIFAASGATTVTGSMISGNSAADRAGGVMNEDVSQFLLEDSVVTANVSGGHAGGVYNNGGRSVGSAGGMTVRASTISQNIGGGVNNGGGFYNNGRLELIDSTVSENSVGVNGGGINTLNPNGGGSLTLIRTKVLRNRANLQPASSGGGISSGGGLVSLTDSTVMQNVSGGGGGGGIGTFGGDLAVSRSTIAENTTAGPGGGIRHSGALNMMNVTMAGNRGTIGGAIDYAGSGGRIVHATIVNNVATTGTASSIVNGGSGLALINSIVFSQVASQCTGTINPTASISNPSSGCGVIGTSFSLPGTVSPLADNGGPTPTMALVFVLGAGAIMDAGQADFCPPVDQRGYPRPQDGPIDSDHDARCDLGAYEWQ